MMSAVADQANAELTIAPVHSPMTETTVVSAAMMGRVLRLIGPPHSGPLSSLS